jgi:hypothetical protein
MLRRATTHRQLGRPVDFVPQGSFMGLLSRLISLVGLSLHGPRKTCSVLLGGLDLFPNSLFNLFESTRGSTVMVDNSAYNQPSIPIRWLSFLSLVSASHSKLTPSMVDPWRENLLKLLSARLHANTILLHAKHHIFN